MSAFDSWSLYTSPRHATRQHLLACHGAGEQSGRLLPFARRTLPTHALVYVSEGRGTYREYRPSRGGSRAAGAPGTPGATGDAALELPIEAPAVIWLAPGVEHGYGPDADGWTEHWILFAGQAFAAFEELGLGNRHRPVVSLHRRVDGTVDAFGELRDALGTIGARPEIAASLATQRFLLSILDAAGDGDGPTDGSAAVTDLVARDAVRPLSVAERAREVGIAPRELSAIVKAATGLTLNDFVIEVRITKAQGLLAETTLDVGRIAALVGYDDPAYFSRVFTRRAGVAPTVFRQQQSRANS